MEDIFSSNDRLEVTFNTNVDEINKINKEIEEMKLNGTATQSTIFPLLERIDKLEHENLCISEALQN